MYIVEIIIFLLLLIDSISAVLMIFIGEKWYTHHFRWFSRLFPPAKGWAIYYLVLTLWIGYLTFFKFH